MHRTNFHPTGIIFIQNLKENISSIAQIVKKDPLPKIQQVKELNMVITSPSNALLDGS